MSYLPNFSSSSVIDAVLTRKGRMILTSSNQVFRIVKYALSDSEINYQLLSSIANIDQDDTDILNLPIPEPSTNENSEMFNKLWVDQTFLGVRFSNFSTAQGENVNVTTNLGNTAIIYSDDTTTQCVAWISTLNALNRPYVADYYHLVFSSDIDFYSIDFVSPVLNDTTNLNYTKLSSTEYIFSAAASDGSAKYTKTTESGAPSIVFNIKFAQTPNYFVAAQLPQNKDVISVPNFLTVTQIDSTRKPLANVTPATLSLQVKNLNHQ